MAQATRWLMTFIGYFIAGVFGVLSCWIPLHARSGSMPPFMAIFLILGDLLLLLGIGLFVAWMINRKEKIRAAEKLLEPEEAQRETKPIGDRTEDKYWKLGGTIYYNPNDPAIWVEKRMGIGWTTNMARRESWYILGAVFGLIGLFMVVVFWIGNKIQ